MRLDNVVQRLDTEALSNLGLRLKDRVRVISGCICIYTLRIESLLGEYHPSVNILSRKSNNEGGGGGTVGQRSDIEALSNLGLGLSRVVFEFTP